MTRWWWWCACVIMLFKRLSCVRQHVCEIFECMCPLELWFTWHFSAGSSRSSYAACLRVRTADALMLLCECVCVFGHTFNRVKVSISIAVMRNGMMMHARAHPLTAAARWRSDDFDCTLRSSMALVEGRTAEYVYSSVACNSNTAQIRIIQVKRIYTKI